MATGNRKGIKGNGVIASIRGKFCVFDSINDRRFCLEKLILEKIEQRRVPHRTSRRNRKDTIRRKLLSVHMDDFGRRLLEKMEERRFLLGRMVGSFRLARRGQRASFRFGF